MATVRHTKETVGSCTSQASTMDIWCNVEGQGPKWGGQGIDKCGKIGP